MLTFFKIGDDFHPALAISKTARDEMLAYAMPKFSTLTLHIVGAADRDVLAYALGYRGPDAPESDVKMFSKPIGPIVIPRSFVFQVVPEASDRMASSRQPATGMAPPAMMTIAPGSYASLLNATQLEEGLARASAAGVPFGFQAVDAQGQIYPFVANSWPAREYGMIDATRWDTGENINVVLPGETGTGAVLAPVQRALIARGIAAAKSHPELMTLARQAWNDRELLTQVATVLRQANLRDALLTTIDARIAELGAPATAGILTSVFEGLFPRSTVLPAQPPPPRAGPLRRPPPIDLQRAAQAAAERRAALAALQARLQGGNRVVVTQRG